MRWGDVLQVFILTLLTAFFITPLIRILAIKTGYVDHPKNNKVHAHPTPLLGGVGIYVAFVIGVLTWARFIHDPKMASILIGAAFLLIVGMIDDRIGMLPEVKLLSQFLGAMIVIRSGVRVDFLHNYYLDTIFTYIWIIGITNSFNLLDNMNGLSAGIAAIAAIFFGFIMWGSGQHKVALIAFALAGALIGFLRHNFPRAKIFMGDAGSLVIGFLLSSLSVLGSWSSPFLTISISMPIIVLAYPIFDTTLVTIIRISEGRSIFQGGKDHSSHRLALLGFRKRRAVLVIYCICALLGIAALVIQRLSIKPAIYVIAGVALFLLMLGIRLGLVDTGRFGRKKGLS